MRDVTTPEDDAPARRLKKFGEQIETGGFASAVWTDKGVNAAASDGEIDIPNGHEAGELLGETIRYQDKIVTHGAQLIGRALACRQPNTSSLAYWVACVSATPSRRWTDKKKIPPPTFKSAEGKCPLRWRGG